MINIPDEKCDEKSPFSIDAERPLFVLLYCTERAVSAANLNLLDNFSRVSYRFLIRNSSSKMGEIICQMKFKEKMR